MVTTFSSQSDSRYRAEPGQGLDGVVRISTGGYYGTGALLFDGQTILTAAHLFDGRTSLTGTVFFETEKGNYTRTFAKVIIHPEHDQDGNNDLALIRLANSAPLTADRYDLYRTKDEINQRFQFVGYGLTGQGFSGADENYAGMPVRLKANNRFDADIGTLTTYLAYLMAWDPISETQLIADFDNGLAKNDALGQLIYREHLGEQELEGLIAQGDSGGPAFINNKLAGIASYSTSLSRGNAHPDIDETTNSSFGEIAAWQRISTYQQWIDTTLRNNYASPPNNPTEVNREVKERDSDTAITYFLVQFIGERQTQKDIVSVRYATRDGSAKAGLDYLAANGTLNIYPGETHAVIPVEIIGDTEPEPQETFYLDIFDPVGGTFGEGVTTLTAVRVISANDAWPV